MLLDPPARSTMLITRSVCTLIGNFKDVTSPHHFPLSPGSASAPSGSSTGSPTVSPTSSAPSSTGTTAPAPGNPFTGFEVGCPYSIVLVHMCSF